MKRWLPIAAALALATIPGCLRTPESLCFEYVDAMRSVFDRCGIFFAEPFDVEWPDGRRGCDGVARVSSADDIVQECLPWTRSEEACERIMVDESSGLVTVPDFCDAMSFQVYD